MIDAISTLANHLIHKIFLTGYVFFVFDKASSQIWHLKPDILKTDSVLKIYSWESSDGNHGASGKIILLKNGKFKYSAHYPLNHTEYSDGSYVIKNSILELNSSLQKNNVEIGISYIDTSITDPQYKRISFPVNNLGERIFDAFYYFNFDTSIAKAYFPKDPTDSIRFEKIHFIKVCFDRAEFESKWIAIKDNMNFIQVRVLTERNYDNYTPKIIDHRRFKMEGNDLIELSGLN